jgi:hypothetical protein
MLAKHIALVIVLVGCADSSSTGNHSVGFRFEVNVAVNAPIDRVAVNGQALPISSGMVDAVVDYADYTEGMNATPLQFDFSSNGQVLYVGHAVAGACQNVCAQENCPDLSMFKHELVTLTAGDFQVHDFECLMCEGPTANIYSCP